MKIKLNKLICQFTLLMILMALNMQAGALDFSSTSLLLNCQGRGNIEVLLHVYGHTQESWDDNFEVGAGHKTVGNVDIVQFVNGDTLLHDKRENSYSYAYFGAGPLHRCLKLEERALYPTF